MNYHAKSKSNRPARNTFQAVARREEFEPTKLPEPTDAMPGSLAKIQVLSQRRKAGTELHATGDKTIRLRSPLVEIVSALREVTQCSGGHSIDDQSSSD